jgi:hypothetical protein
MEITRQREDTPSTEILRPIEDTPSTAIRAASAPMPSVGTIMAVRPGVFRRVGARASVVEADSTVVEAEDFTAAAVVAGGGDRGFVGFPNELVRVGNGEMLYAGDGTKI